jgi:hypothetical protein
MERTASCVCGQLSVTIEGDPAIVNMCHCTDCQRRTGSPFQIGAFFKEEQLKSVEGEFTTYVRTANSGRTIDVNFCPTCGVSVFFRPQARPGIVGVFGGSFADPDFPAPTQTSWTQSKHHWIDLPDVPADKIFEQQSS